MGYEMRKDYLPNSSNSALKDITVLDLSRVICGPYSTMILGDFGANIIKIETPNGGDDTRAWVPFLQDYSIEYLYLNRNKRGITLNLKSEEGKKIFKDLVKQADVVVENFRPGVMKRLGLDYEEPRKINDKIIYASASGFGTYGPFSDKPGYDVIAQAMGGIMSLNGPIEGEWYKAGAAIADITTGMNLVIGIMMALYHREHTGVGQRFEVALVDSIVSLISTETHGYLATGIKTKRWGNKNEALSPYGNYKAKDAYFVLCCGNQKLYEVFCNEVMKRPELITDERFITLRDRAENYDVLKDIIEEWAAQYTASEIVEMAESKGVPASPIWDIEQVYHCDHIREAREMFIETSHPVLGKVTQTGSPYKMSETKTGFYRSAPELGEHNEEILTSMLGKTHEEIQKLKEIGAI